MSNIFEHRKKEENDYESKGNNDDKNNFGG
jgi:hypothetical protein